MKEITSNEIKALLAKKYCPPAYAFFTEVSKSGVGSLNGYIDGVAFALYPSLQHEIHGFEVKVNRQDFLREFEKPAKSADAMENCDRWWVVAPKGVLDKRELPDNWGFYEVCGNRLYRRKFAPILKRKKFNISFIAGLLRRATENTIPRSIYWKEIDEEKEVIRQEFREEIDKAKANLVSYMKKVGKFEAKSGIKILESWKDGEEIGEAVEFVLNNKFDLDWEILSIKNALEVLEKANKVFKNKSPSKRELTN